MKNDQAPSTIDYEAYVDGQLDAARRFAVEDHLSRHPQQAAQLMSDLSLRTGLQLLHVALPPLSAGTAALAQRLQQPSPPRRRLMPAAMVAAFGLVASSLVLMSWLRSPPAYVIDALSSHRTAMLRATLASQLESPGFDAEEILRATQISMPALPEGWHVTDVQLFPYPKGLALLIAVRTTGNQALSIFAVRERSSAPARPDAVREGRQSIAYWSENGVSYALTGDGEPAAIDATAETLAALWKS